MMVGFDDGIYGKDGVIQSREHVSVDTTVLESGLGTTRTSMYH